MILFKMFVWDGVELWKHANFDHFFFSMFISFPIRDVGPSQGQEAVRDLVEQKTTNQQMGRSTPESPIAWPKVWDTEKSHEFQWSIAATGGMLEGFVVCRDYSNYLHLRILEGWMIGYSKRFRLIDCNFE